LLVVLRHGADFASVAKRYSADTASREQGGELGWFRRGVMFTSFEDVKMKIKEILSNDLAIRHYVDLLRRQTYIDIRL